MKITRMDLDMTGSPMGLVTKILAAEPTLPIPTPVEELAARFDIQEIAELTTEGFEGGLLTQPERTSGIILVNKGAHPTRRKFTIGHELGHFLILSHQPAVPGKFLCKREDMREWDAKSQDRYVRMEAEANQFSALLLMPPPRLRTSMKSFRKPDISDILTIAEQFQVSKEAAARSYVEYHEEAVAVIVVKDGMVLRSYKGRDFPFITATYGKRIPVGSGFCNRPANSSEMQECGADVWFDKPGATVQEQICIQREGFAFILLWAEISEVEEFDADENRTSAERYRHRMAKWQ